MQNSTGSQPVERALRLSIFDGIFAAVMVGASESYFGVCAVALGHTNLALALLVTLPLLCGALTQAFTGPLVLLLGSRKRLVVASVFVQALSHIGLIAVAWLNVHALWPLLALLVLYASAGMVSVPAWGAWMGALTESIDRARYFAIRSACVSVALLGAFLWGGYHLQAGENTHRVARAYAAVFAVGLLARSLSSFLLYLQHDPSVPPRDSLLRVLARTRTSLRGEGFRLALGLALVMMGAHVAIPFYAPYMLKTLKLGYVGFALLCAVQLAGKSVVFPFTHRISAHLGLERLLLLSVGMVALVAWMWGAFTSTWGLVVAQIISGFAWAGYEFASFQLLLRSARSTHRVEFLAVAASLGGLLQLLGALFGSLLLSHAGFAYRDVFMASAVGRCLPLLLLVPLLHDKRTPGTTQLASIAPERQR